MSTATLIKRTRMLIQDTGQPFVAQFPLDGVSTLFNLPEESISAYADPPQVIIGGTPILNNAATPQYYIDYKHGVIAFYAPPEPAGANLAVIGTTYDFFDDDEVYTAVNDSFGLHVADQDPLPAIDPGLGQVGVTKAEEYCISILAAIELLWFRATDASQTIDIDTPEGVHISRSERFRQITAQIQSLKAEYNQIAGALGVGLYRVQILDQRRISYTTNRYVPVFRGQEYNAPYTGFEPTAAPVGAAINIFGRYFTGTLQVTFGGVPSQNFVVQNDQLITAVVPPGAITGQIGIMTATGIVLSTAQFTVGSPPPFVLYGPELVHLPNPPGS